MTDFGYSFANNSRRQENMFRVFNCLSAEHDLRLVALAGIVCFLASVTAINLFHRARSTRAGVRAAWLITAGAATGCGIWGTHFIAMLAYEPGVPTAYDIGLTLLSLVIAAGVAGGGVRGGVYSASRWVAESPVCTTSACGRSKCRVESRGGSILLPSPSRSAWSSEWERWR